MRPVKRMIAATVLAAAATGSAAMITAAAPAASAAPGPACVHVANSFACSFAYAYVSPSSSGYYYAHAESCVNGTCTSSP